MISMTHTDGYRTGMNHLREYIAREGHANVPARHVAGDGFKLGAWVGHRRNECRVGRLTTARITELNVLGTPNTGAFSVHGAIRGHREALGWEAGPTGYPTTDERTTPDGVGRYNHFTGGDGASIYWTPATGAQ